MCTICCSLCFSLSLKIPTLLFMSFSTFNFFLITTLLSFCFKTLACYSENRLLLSKKSLLFNSFSSNFLKTKSFIYFFHQIFGINEPICFCQTLKFFFYQFHNIKVSNGFYLIFYGLIEDKPNLKLTACNQFLVLLVVLLLASFLKNVSEIINSIKGQFRGLKVSQ